MTYIEEMTAAGRGILALILGRRDASRYFDLTLRGLVGSFVAFLIATSVNAYLPAFLGSDTGGTHPWQALLMVATLYLLQVGFSVMVLNQIKRLDGLLPYIVADNWATFFVTVLTIILGLAGLGSDVSLFMIGLLVIIIEINIARLIVTLTPLQIAMFLIAQLVGVTMGLMAIGLLFPVPTAL